MNYGYAKHAVHLVNITAPKGLQAGAPIVLSQSGELVGIHVGRVPDSLLGYATRADLIATKLGKN